MQWHQKIRVSSQTDLGCRRQNNEDYLGEQLCTSPELWHARGHLFVVADGMGGHAVGEMASKAAVDTIMHTFLRESDEDTESALLTAMKNANLEVNRKGGNRDFQRMGTTCSALSLTPEGAIIAHVGDSRIYRVRGDHIQQLTFDHSLQWELMKKTGKSLAEVEAEEPKNVITRCLGPEPDIKIDTEGPHRIHPGDDYLLCSDGLTNYVTDSEMGIIAKNLPAEDAAQLLVHLACLRGGSDNITVIIAQLASDPTFEKEEAAKKELAIAMEKRVSIFRWVGLVIFILLLIGGVVLSVMVNEILGAILAIPSLIASVVLFLNIRSIAKQKALSIEEPSNKDDPKPYTSTDCRFSHTFINEINTLGKAAYNRAKQEQWDIDEAEVRSLIEKSQSELKNRHPRKCLHEWANAIRLILDARPEQDVSL